jgi:hypothetical protein
MADTAATPPTDDQVSIVDEGALHHYRTEIPNTVIRGLTSRGLSIYAKWLYVYLKSLAGAGSTCWCSPATMAQEAGMSRGQVSAATQELVAHHLITVTQDTPPHRAADDLRIVFAEEPAP